MWYRLETLVIRLAKIILSKLFFSVCTDIDLCFKTYFKKHALQVNLKKKICTYGLEEIYITKPLAFAFFFFNLSINFSGLLINFDISSTW